MVWLLVALTWTLVAFVVAVVVGRGIRLADESAAPATWTDEVYTFLRRHSDGSAAQPATGPHLHRF